MKYFIINWWEEGELYDQELIETRDKETVEAYASNRRVFTALKMGYEIKEREVIQL